MNQVREAFNKSLKRRKEDARVRVEVACDREEALKPMVKDNDGGAGTGAISSSSLPLPASLLAQSVIGPGTGTGAGGGAGAGAGVAHTPDTQSHHLSPALALLASAQGQGLAPATPRPESVSGCVPLDGEVTDPPRLIHKYYPLVYPCIYTLRSMFFPLHTYKIYPLGLPINVFSLFHDMTPT